MSAAVARPLVAEAILGPTVLGKRRRTTQIVDGRLRVVEERVHSVRARAPVKQHEEDESGFSEDEREEQSASEYEPDSEEHLHLGSTSAAVGQRPPSVTTAKARSRSKTKSRSATPSTKRNKSAYPCTWEGCTKSYSKPVRLAEHVRSHTGERPFVCLYPGCGQSYLRENHLQAHERSHKDDNEKPLQCSEAGCDKRFWTHQHLNRHKKLVHDKERGAYECDQCPQAFNKHHKLRSHGAEAHMPEGTNPFVRDHPACDKSFSTGSKLRLHKKVHDEKRYVCMHPSHVAGEGLPAICTDSETRPDKDPEPPSFPTWSALQAHNKQHHPPMCLHPGCARVFRSNKGLRKHILKRHLAPEFCQETSAAMGIPTIVEDSIPNPDEDISDDGYAAANMHGSTSTANPLIKPAKTSSSTYIPTQTEFSHHAGILSHFREFDGVGDYADM